MPCRVYWLNPVTEEMELCVVKSLKISEALRHPDGWAGYHKDALREVTGMCRVAGVQGVAEFRDIIVEPSGAIHLILGYEAPCACFLPPRPLFSLACCLLLL
jgi:hypothetical protein